MTKKQRKAVRRALREFDGSGPWVGVLDKVRDYYAQADPVCWELLRLRYLDGKSWGECARRMGYADESGPRKLVERYLRMG